METLRLRVDVRDLHEAGSERSLDKAAALLRNGGTVALPTETVYGLGANALDPAAIAKIFVAKERPGWDPLIVHIADEAMLARVTESIPEAARTLMAAFWPGPMTLLLPRSSEVPDAVTAGRPLVGVRMPRHPVALELIRRAGVPIAAPSANRFGRTSPTTAAHVLEDLDGRIDAVIDAGPTQFGVESTVIDPNHSPIVIYRPGAVTIDEVREVAGPTEFFVESGYVLDSTEARAGLPSPGVGVRHYAPRARLILIKGGSDLDTVCAKLGTEAESLLQDRVGILWPEQQQSAAEERIAGLKRQGILIFYWGAWGDEDELARRLFAGLRNLDAEGCSVILCPVPSGRGVGAAIRDRLRKAAYRND